MTQIYRTTKIPAFYFRQIEEYLKKTDEFVSVSEFIRDSIKEKLSNTNERWFLLWKDVVFNEETIIGINKKIAKSRLMKSVPLQSIINSSMDIDYVTFLSKFLVKFAYIHPFEDGNKRTSWTAVDIFLRLNKKRLRLKADSEKETDDEIFIWQNSANQKTVEQIKDFLSCHIISYPNSSQDIETELTKSMEENSILLSRLSR